MGARQAVFSGESWQISGVFAGRGESGGVVG
jgi:hypothetical protein